MNSKILQSLALAVLKNSMQDFYYQAIDLISSIIKATSSVITRVLKNFHHYIVFQIKYVTNESLHSIKIKV